MNAGLLESLRRHKSFQEDYFGKMLQWKHHCRAACFLSPRALLDLGGSMPPTVVDLCRFAVPSRDQTAYGRSLKMTWWRGPFGRFFGGSWCFGVCHGGFPCGISVAGEQLEVKNCGFTILPLARWLSANQPPDRSRHVRQHDVIPQQAIRLAMEILLAIHVERRGNMKPLTL